MKQNTAELYRPSEFAKMVGVTKRTLRYYDQIDLLSPTYKNEAAHRYYSVEDIEKMQRIAALKFIGLPISEIREILSRNYSIKESLQLQQQIMQDKVKQIESVMKAISEIEEKLDHSEGTNWLNIFNVIKATQMEQYYSDRAKEYDEIYTRQDEIRQQEQKQMYEQMKKVFNGKNVLEIASGTGYWTKAIAEVAKEVAATDVSDEMQKECKKRLEGYKNIKFLKMDAYKLDIDTDKNYNAACANFWISHVPKSRLDEFLTNLNSKLGSGTVVFIADNVYVPGIGGEFIAKPGIEDTYKIRKLANGKTYEVLKNYYQEKELNNMFGEFTSNLCIHIGKCFWWLWYTIK